MNLQLVSETAAPDFSRRLPPAPSFDEASRSVEAALDELRPAEPAAEQQAQAA